MYVLPGTDSCINSYIGRHSSFSPKNGIVNTYYSVMLCFHKHVLYACTVFKENQSPMVEHLSCLHFFTIVKDPMMNIFITKSYGDKFLSIQIPVLWLLLKLPSPGERHMSRSLNFFPRTATEMVAGDEHHHELIPFMHQDGTFSKCTSYLKLLFK